MERAAAFFGYKPLTLAQAKTDVADARDRYHRVLEDIRRHEGVGAASGRAYDVRGRLTTAIKILNERQARLSRFEGHYSVTPLKEEYVGESIGVEWTNDLRAMFAKVYYITDSSELERYRISADESGRLRDSEGALLNGAAMFVMDQTGNAYAFSRFGTALPNGKHLRHSSFLQGEALASSGQLHTENGRLVKVDRRSGHYFPSDAANKQFLDMLQKKGVDVSKTIVERGY
ncbi:MAG: hypothetical protein Q7J64_04905 [Elusimicrobiota bacterium]|nr:hypothetical protein [Elusimicrobiota bacterium]